ncbi:MAG: hypothetical protein NC218_08575 [Acetobacter sp.]|nr:hypothetical protein [Acetobacter sp.]
MAEFEASLPWTISDSGTTIAVFNNFSSDGLTVGYTFYKNSITTINANAVYKGASPEYDNVAGYNWKFSIPEPYKVKVEQTTASQGGGSSSGAWKLTLLSQGHPMDIVDISSDNLPMNIVVDSTTGLNIKLTEVASDGKSFIVEGYVEGSKLTSEIITQDNYSDYDALGYKIYLEEPYHIHCNDMT